MTDKFNPDYDVLDTHEVLGALFHPRKTAGPRQETPSSKDVLIPVDGKIAIGACFHTPHSSGPLILFFHGNGEVARDYDDIGPLFGRLGINFIVADFRGYGFSGGNPTVSSMMADCHRVLDFVADWQTQNNVSGPLIVMGRSLGSASAIELAMRHADRIDGLVVESGFAWAGPLLRLLGVDPDRIGFDESNGFANVDKIKKVTMPTTIIHAEFDHIIPYSDGEALHAACSATDKTLVKIPGANHNDIFMRGLDRYLEAVSNLAKKLDSIKGNRKA